MFIFSGLTCISTAQYAVLYKTIEEMGVPIYSTLEDIVRFAIPAIILPTKWSNVTRKVARNLNKGVHISSVVLSAMDKPAINLKQDFIGPECESFGIRLNHLQPEVESSIPSSNVTVEVFHEVCVYKSKNNYCWSDVSSWMKKTIIPEDFKMKCTPDRMKYLNQKVKKITRHV